MRSKSNYLMAGLLLVQLGMVEAEAACQIQPQHTIAYPGQSVQLSLACGNGEVFDSIKWTAQLNGTGSVMDLTGVVAVPAVLGNQISYNLPVSSLGDVTTTAKVYHIDFVGVAAPAAAASITPARVTLTPATEVALTVVKSGTGSVVSGPSGIDCGTTCSDTFPLNSQVMLQATAGSDAYFSGWSGDCIGTGSCQISMTGAKSVTATFGAIVNGQCGTADGVARTTAPAVNLCSDGSTPTVSPTASAFGWTCAGTPGLGNSATCSAPRQYTVSVDATTNGTLSPNTAQNVTYGNAQSFTITPTASYSATLDPASNCGGTVASGGLSYTTAPITQACTVKMNFTNAPTCGSANSVLATAAPAGGALCSVGTASAVSSGSSAYTWSCAVTGQTSAQCSAPKGYTVSIGTISGGTISPNTTQTLAQGATPQFTLTPTTSGQVVTMGGTCGNLTATDNGSGGFTYTTAALANSCTISATFDAPSTGCPSGCSCPSNLIQINTDVPTAQYPRTDFLTVAPEKIYSFKVKSRPDVGVIKSGTGSVAMSTSSRTSKRVILSECPGSAVPVNSNTKCSKYGTEVSSVTHYTNTTATGYCTVNPDTVYYFNVFSKANVTDTGYLCGNANSPGTATTDCAFSFNAN